MKEVYQNEEDGNVVGDTLEDMVREGGRRRLAPLLAVEDGALGLWSALDRVYPTMAQPEMPQPPRAERSDPGFRRRCIPRPDAG